MECQKWLLLCAPFVKLISDGLGGVQSISMYNIMIYSQPTICSKSLNSSPCEMCRAKFAFFSLATNFGTVHPKFSWNIRLIINCDPPLILLISLTNPSGEKTICHGFIFRLDNFTKEDNFPTFRRGLLLMYLHSNQPFNLHLDFWKWRSWEIKVCFKP